MKYYELTYLISPDLSEEELKTLWEKINTFIREEEGTLEKTINPVKRKLGYSINEKNEAFWGIFNFHLGSEKLKILEKKLKSESQILRYIILTKKEPKKISPTEGLDGQKIAIEEERIIITPKTTRPQKVELKEVNQKIDEILNE